MIKHILIYDNIVYGYGQFVGRYGVKYENHLLEIKTIAGEDLRLKYLKKILEKIIDLDEAKMAHKSRQHPWRVKYKKGSSGCYDFWVEELVDPEWGIIQRGLKLHISMKLKLNEGLKISIADLAAILDHPQFPFPEEWFDDKYYEGVKIKIIDIDIDSDREFNPPGTNTRGEFDEEEKEEKEEVA